MVNIQRGTYRIYPILVSKLSLDKGTFTYRSHYGEKILAPVWAWLIKGGKEPFLIDTGCSIKEVQNLSPALEGEDGPPMEESLQKLGVVASDIRTVILTHMHKDHFLNAKKFPNARIVVQEEELKFARNPHPAFVRSYNPAWYEKLTFDTVSGDTEILSGVELLFTPGHSPGTQSVSIATEQGKVVIVGACSIDENFSESGDILPGVHTDIFEAYDSIIKLRGLGRRLIPLHSQSILGIECIP